MAPFVDQQHRDAIIDAICQAALGIGAVQLRATRTRAIGQRRPALWASQDLSQPRLDHQTQFPRTTDNTSSRTRAIVASSEASTLSRNNGSVLLARRLNHHIGVPLCLTVIPSSSSKSTSWPAVRPHA